MNLRGISYFIEEAFKNTFRNSIMSITSVVTVAACVFMVTFLYAIAINVDFSLEQLETSTGTMKVHITDEATNDDITALYTKLVALEHIDTVTFVNSEQALAEFKEQYGYDAGLFEGLEGGSVLRRRFVVTLDSTRYLDAVIAQLDRLNEESHIISSVFNIKDVTNLLTTVSNVIRVVCVLIIVILAVLSVVIIVNTIKLSVNSRRNEISIMKYVGATDWFIKWPFVLEGLFIGALGAVIPILLFGIAYDWLTGSVTSFFLSAVSMSFALKPGVEVFSMVIPLSILFGGVIGVVGSLFSIKRYLNV